MSGFEGSFLGATNKISAQAVMECKICWTAYEPSEGDETRQIPPGTPFIDLPQDWKCPQCDAPKEQFMVLEDPGSDLARQAARIAEMTTALEADFIEIWRGKMRDVPLVNKALHVQAVGFKIHDGRPLGVLVSPWFMNLVQLPADDEDWQNLVPGEKEVQTFPSGDYEFMHNKREKVGGYKACSLFSMMGEFGTQAQAIAVAEAIMLALFDENNRAETDRSADIRAAREAEVMEGQVAKQGAPTDTSEEADVLPDTPTRRQVISAGLAR